ncbi:MAG TPA: serine hydrolase domain-containing protein [Gemmatimonadales bacterium]|nr:serine hydrolase domain-containing protein [Gemmatimonadales bacterium]
MNRTLASLVMLAAVLPASLPVAVAQTPATASAPIDVRVQAKLDSAWKQGKFPGATLGIAFADGNTLGLAVGMADTTKHEAMKPTSLMPQGSVGKTYVAAVALQLVDEGRLALDAPVSRYLGKEPWYHRLPNAETMTVRQIMSHTSGLVRYEFDERFIADLLKDPYKIWTVEEQLAYLFDQPAPFAAGQGWDYSDTNYLVLGLIIEKLTGRKLNDEIQRRVIRPAGLRETIPNDKPELPVVQGYAGADNPFGGDVMIVNGRMTMDPAFEGAGGGWSSSASDLARWAKKLYEGSIVPAARIAEAVQGVPARLGPEVRYGLGVIIWPSPKGPIWGHSGYFPGYITEMRYYPDAKIAIALQMNTSVPRAFGRAPGGFLNEIAEMVRSTR